jgi:hypothetical protein
MMYHGKILESILWTQLCSLDKLCVLVAGFLYIAGLAFQEVLLVFALT